MIIIMLQMKYYQICLSLHKRLLFNCQKNKRSNTNGGFVIFYDNLLDKIYKGNIEITSSALRIIVYFAKHIEFNSNVIKVRQQDIAKELNLTLATVNKCIQYLKDIRVIYPIGHCDIIINHNYIFRGNMLQFYEDYKRLYPDQKGEIF